MSTKLTVLLGILFCVTLAFSAHIGTSGDQFWAGVGISDITGPAADVNMMGYAVIQQTTNGIHLRLYSRAYIIADGLNSANRVVFVSADMGMVSQLVKLDVLKQLKQSYGDLYTAKNVLLSGTHTHSAPAGFFQYFLYEVTSLGFVKESHDKFVNGIVDSIKKAHANLKPASLYLNSGELVDTQMNRSPTSYLKNPQAERDLYGSNTDHVMHLLRINDANGNPMGMVNWYPVHGVSMNNTNRLISGDNKGYAAQLFERAMEPHSLAGHASFVGAFAQAFEGDVSPNTAGPRCLDSGLPCDLETSTCNGKPLNCVAFGPGKDMFESTKIIGENQFKKAMELFNTAKDKGTRIKGDIQFVHKYVDMTNVTVDLGDGKTGRTCIPAMGYAFGAGTTDGTTDLPFTQHTESGNPFWDAVRNMLATPTPDMVKCHHPKPILLTTGLMKFPYPWQPTIIDIQMAKIGQLVIVPVPGEFTTMSGRRLIAAVKNVFKNAGEDVHVIIAGLSNVYTHYITTPEEYSNQRYEGASTMFGPYTLPAYIQLYSELAKALIAKTVVPEGPQPPYIKDKQWEMLPPVIFDNAGLNRKFGDVRRQPAASYKPGETVKVEFQGANPRSSVGTDLKTFMTVDKAEPTKQSKSMAEMVNSWLGWGKKPSDKPTLFSSWRTVFTDAEWETRFTWQRESAVLGTSKATLEWEIPTADTVEPGTYRICYYGHSKNLLTGIKPFSGCTRNFEVTVKEF